MFPLSAKYYIICHWSNQYGIFFNIMHAILNIAINAARSASKIIVHSMDRMESGRISNKNKMELALEKQEQANEEITEIIHDLYPMHKVISNQTSAQEYAEEDFVWLINSIDGIVNYAHGLPHFAITIAVKHKNKILHGMIYDSMRQDLFTASFGDGAILNDRRIRASQDKDLANVLLATTTPQQENDLPSHNQIISELLPQTAGVRNYGCPSLDLAYVAAGKFEGFWGFGISESSLATGALMVQESGGIVSDFQSTEHYLKTGNIIAANPKNYRVLAKIISDNLAS